MTTNQMDLLNKWIASGHKELQYICMGLYGFSSSHNRLSALRGSFCNVKALFNAILENVCSYLSACMSAMNIAGEGMLVKLLDDLPFTYSRKTLEDKMGGYFVHARGYYLKKRGEFIS
ncbi:hypothetical protein KSP39_PZI001141 [Platanthera zijinensis]|uniref:Uncharacterized protein n=1 Tax=Platanthera zijinensis TaxID=2320716 RepID=A0AAP0GG15_9ASPA